MMKKLMLALSMMVAMPVYIITKENSETKPEYSQTLKDFLKKFAPSDETCQLIEKNKEEIAGHWFGEVDVLPGIFFKGTGVNRVINAVRARNFIKQNNLNSLDVAEKSVYEVDGEFKVLAKKIKHGGKAGKLTLEETQQLAAFAEGTGFRDWGLTESNLIKDKNGKYVFIDTEDMSFLVVTDTIEGVPANNPLQYLMGLYKYTGSMCPEAQTWYINRVNQLLNECMNNKEQCEKNIVTPLPYNSKLDDEGANFEEVKKEITAMREAKDLAERANSEPLDISNDWKRMAFTYKKGEGEKVEAGPCEFGRLLDGQLSNPKLEENWCHEEEMQAYIEQCIQQKPKIEAVSKEYADVFAQNMDNIGWAYFKYRNNEDPYMNFQSEQNRKKGGWSTYSIGNFGKLSPEKAKYIVTEMNKCFAIGLEDPSGKRDAESKCVDKVEALVKEFKN